MDVGARAGQRSRLLHGVWTRRTRVGPPDVPPARQERHPLGGGSDGANGVGCRPRKVGNYLIPAFVSEPVMNLRLPVRRRPQTPFVSLGAIVSLALGIGANAAIFSLFDQTLLRPLAVVRPSELVNL